MSGYVEVYRDAAKEWRWRRKSGERIVSDSGEGYHHRTDAMAAAARFNPDVPVRILPPPKAPPPPPTP